MTNFPGNWLSFSEYKEIKRLRKAMTETISLRIQITASAIITILSAFLSSKANEWSVCSQMIFISCACLLVIGVIWGPAIVEHCKFFITNNIILNGKKAINIFDDEIVYDIMIATEFEKLIDTEKNGELKIFYKAEMTYYVKKSMESLILMSASYSRIFGPGEQQVSIERVRNINTIINNLLEKCMTIDKSIRDNYVIFIQNIESL